VARLDSRLLGAVFAGGAVGSVARAAVGRALSSPAGGWPWATFAVNVLGTLILGWSVTRLQERLPPSAYRRPFLATGVCGGLTTFSTLQLELVDLLRAGDAALALAYAAASLGLGFVAVWGGVRLARRGWILGP
jgi:CrcB protein